MLCDQIIMASHLVYEFASDCQDYDLEANDRLKLRGLENKMITDYEHRVGLISEFLNQERKILIWNSAATYALKVRPDFERLYEIVPKGEVSEKLFELVSHLARLHVRTYLKLQPPRFAGGNDLVPLIDADTNTFEKELLQMYVPLLCESWEQLGCPYHLAVLWFQEEMRCVRTLIVRLPTGSLTDDMTMCDSFMDAIRCAVREQWGIEAPPQRLPHWMAHWIASVTSAFVVFTNTAEALDLNSIVNPTKRRERFINFIGMCISCFFNYDGLYFLIANVRPIFHLVEPMKYRVIDAEESTMFIVLRA